MSPALNPPLTPTHSSSITNLRTGNIPLNCIIHNHPDRMKNKVPLHSSRTGEMDEMVIIQTGILNGKHKVTMLTIPSLVSVNPATATENLEREKQGEPESTIEVFPYPLKGTNQEDCTESLLKKFPSNLLAKVLLSDKADKGFSIKLAANDKGDEYMLNDRFSKTFQADQRENGEEGDSHQDGDLSWDDLLYEQGCHEIVFKRIDDCQNDGLDSRDNFKIGMNGNGQQNELECSPTAKGQKMLIGYRFVKRLT